MYGELSCPFYSLFCSLFFHVVYSCYHVFNIVAKIINTIDKNVLTHSLVCWGLLGS